MRPRLVRIAAEAVQRLADQTVAVENARVASTALARGRVERLEVEQFLEQYTGDAWRRRSALTRHQTLSARPHR